MENFVPIQIGLHNAKKEAEIRSFYQQLCMDADSILFDLSEYLEIDRITDPSIFFDFMNSTDPREFLYSVWIQSKGITTPAGFSLPKVIELDLIDVPRERFDLLISERNELLKTIQAKQSELKFNFSLSHFFEIKNGFGQFIFPGLYDDGFTCEAFEQALFNHVRVFTQTPEENKVVELLNNFVHSLNDMIEFGLMPNSKGTWRTKLDDKLLEYLTFAPGTERPLSIDPRITYQLSIRRGLGDTAKAFPEPKRNKRLGTVSDILKFNSGEDQAPINWENDFDEENFDEEIEVPAAVQDTEE